MNFFALSLPVGRYAGISVRVHFTFFISGLYFLQQFGDRVIFGLAFIICGYFLSILLHEFGHAFAARFCDGEADEIIIWSFGGLALCRPIFNPTAQLITTVAGPLVTLVLWGLFSLIGFITTRVLPDSAFGGLTYQTLELVAYMAWFNKMILFFNLIPAFPMDGGRILQELLWYRMGYERATEVAVFVSKALAVVGMGLGFSGIWGGTWIGMLSLMVFFGSSQQAMAQAASAIIQPFSLKERLKQGKRRKAFKVSVSYKINEESSQGFHRCAACGKTELDSSDLVFRVVADGQEYCSDHLPSRGQKS